MNSIIPTHHLGTLFGVALLSAIPAHASPTGSGNPNRDPARYLPVGAVYTMDNSSAGNNIWAFPRRVDGSLGAPTVHPTGGAGTGSGLGNQGAVQLSRDGRWLVTVNAGSDGISAFSVTSRGLRLLDTAPCQGTRPISVALHGNWIYVLNAGGGVSGGQDTIEGFELVGDQLQPLADSSRTLSQANTGPAEIQFTPDGEHLVVTEKATGLIDTFQVDDHGLVFSASAFPSPVPTPFGFAVGRRNRIFVTQANGGGANPGGSSLSSYAIQDDGDLIPISTSVPTTQTAACWVTLSRDERFAYTANTPNASISQFEVNSDGSLRLVQAQAGTARGPADLSPSRDGRWLYSLNTGDGTIGGFAIHPRTGGLTPIGSGVGLPATVNGLAVW